MFGRKKKKAEKLTIEASQRLEAGDPQTAHMLLSQALELDNTSGMAWFVMGQILDAMGNQKEAFEAYKGAASLAPDKAYLAYFNMACMLDRAGEWKSSIEVYGQILKLVPDMADAWINMGRALDELGSFQEAMKAYDRAMELAPEDTDLLGNLANTLRKMRLYKESIEICKKALGIDPRLVHVREIMREGQRALGLADGLAEDEVVPAEDMNFRYSDSEDPAMQAAVAEARQTLAHFAQSLASPEPGAEYYLKATFRDSSESQAEHMWIANPRFENGKWYGQIGNEPKIVTCVSLDDAVELSVDQICDWMIMRGGQMEGGYTAKVLMGA